MITVARNGKIIIAIDNPENKRNKIIKDLRAIIKYLKEGNYDVRDTPLTLDELINSMDNKFHTDDSVKWKMLKTLAHYVSTTDSMESVLAALEEQSEIDGSVPADDIVTMWEPLEGRYTVDNLLTEITP